MKSNTSPPCITAAAGTDVSRGLFIGYRHYLRQLYRFTALWLSSTNKILLDQAFAHCPKFLTADSIEFGPFFSPNVAGRFLKPTRDH